MSIQQVTVIIVTHNEEAHIEQCLTSVMWAHELIVVDGESTDRTVEIARCYTDHVITRQNEINPEINKNFGIAQATKDWILCLDADERVGETLRDEIREVLSTRSTVVGYWIPRKNFIFNQWMRYGQLYPDYQLRLFQRGHAAYPGRTVHESTSMEGSTGYLCGHIIHVGTLRSFAHWMEKANAYTTLEASARANQMSAPYWRNAVFGPLRRFISHYVVSQGFRDGWLGFCWAGLAAAYEFLVVLKTWEHRYQKADNARRV